MEYYSAIKKNAFDSVLMKWMKLEPVIQSEVSQKEKHQYSSVQFSSVQSLSRVRLFATPWTVAYQAPPSMGFSWQEYWSGFPFSSPGDLPDPGIEPGSPALPADTLTSEPPGKPNATYKPAIIKLLILYYQLG